MTARLIEGEDMPSPRVAMYHGWLQCDIEQLSYDFRTRTGRLDFPECNCCDMEGAIEIFTSIDPGVLSIVTYAAGKLDTVYMLLGKEWQAFLPAKPD